MAGMDDVKSDESWPCMRTSSRSRWRMTRAPPVCGTGRHTLSEPNWLSDRGLSCTEHSAHSNSEATNGCVGPHFMQESAANPVEAGMMECNCHRS